MTPFFVAWKFWKVGILSLMLCDGASKRKEMFWAFKLRSIEEGV